MQKKHRVFNAIRLKKVDRIPTSYRGSDYISVKLMEYYGIENPDDLKAGYKELLEKLGADFWSSGSKIGKFSTFFPKYTGPFQEEALYSGWTNVPYIGHKLEYRYHFRF